MIPRMEVLFIGSKKASRAEVENFLKDVRCAIDNGNAYFIKRKSTVATFRKVGCTRQDALDVIYNLTYDEYYRGPKEHYDDPNEDYLWEFKTQYEYFYLYIKVQVRYQKDSGLCIYSFHIDGE